MAEDWATDVKKYAPNADDAVIARLVSYCGIALRNRDSSLVSFSDPQEIARVRDNFCRKKLGLTDPDTAIEAEIARVGERMSGDRTKNRVTVYYLLTEAYGKLGLFGGGSAAATSGAIAGDTIAGGAVAGGAAAAGAAPAFAFSGTTGAGTRPAAVRDDRAGFGGFALLVLGALGAIIIGTATLGSLIGDRVARAPVLPATTQADVAPIAAVTPPSVPTPAAPAVPEGAGVVAQDTDGKPMVSVYFDTAKTDIAPGFAAAAAPVKAWVDAHPGARLAVSGYNDARGNAAFNAELSKNRAKAVAAALVGIGVPADAIDLVKPPETTDADANLSQARRVDIVIKDAG